MNIKLQIVGFVAFTIWAVSPPSLRADTPSVQQYEKDKPQHDPPLDRLSQDNLLQFRDADQGVRVVKTRKDWQRRRSTIIRAMDQVMGPLPSDDRRVALDIKVIEESDAGNYVRKLITYQSEPGCLTPAYLCIPKNASAGNQVPAVLCLHPTDNNVGHKVVVGLGGREGRTYASELAANGYVTLAPSYPLLADYQPDLKELGYASGTMKAIWDNVRGLDLLETLPQVDSSRGFAAIGHSLGGHNAIFTTVLDSRIQVIVTSCGFDSFRDYNGADPESWQAGKRWCQERYMPRLASYHGRLQDIPFDFPELLGAIAPRTIFVSAPKGDSNFDWKSVGRCATAAKPIFELLGAVDNLTVRHPACNHDFPEPLRQASYRVIDSALKPPSSIKP